MSNGATNILLMAAILAMALTGYSNAERVKSNQLLAGELKAFRLVLEQTK